MIPRLPFDSARAMLLHIAERGIPLELLEQGITRSGGSESDLRRAPLLVDEVRGSAREVCRMGSIFDFGEFTNATIKEVSVRASTFEIAGKLPHPFDFYAFYHTWEEGSSLYLVGVVGPATEPHLIGQRVVVSEWVALPPGMQIEGHPWVWKSSAYFYGVDPVEKKYQGTVFSLAGGGSGELANLLDPLVSIRMALVTRGLGVARRAAPQALNRARVKAGRLPIPDHWAVNTPFYATAIRETHQSDRRGGNPRLAEAASSARSPATSRQWRGNQREGLCRQRAQRGGQPLRASSV